MAKQGFNGVEGFARDQEMHTGSEISDKDASLEKRLSTVREGFTDLLSIGNQSKIFSEEEMKELEEIVSALDDSIAKVIEQEGSKDSSPTIEPAAVPPSLPFYTPQRAFPSTSWCHRCGLRLPKYITKGCYYNSAEESVIQYQRKYYPICSACLASDQLDRLPSPTHVVFSSTTVKKQDSERKYLDLDDAAAAILRRQQEEYRRPPPPQPHRLGFSGAIKRRAADDDWDQIKRTQVKRPRTESEIADIPKSPAVEPATGGWLEEWVMTGTAGWLED